MRFVTCLLLFIMAVGICASLSCPKCKPKYCKRYVEPKLNCTGNLIKDVCFCCYTCAKQINEKCGGRWNLYGRCDIGLECYYSYHIPPGHLVIDPGVCKRKREYVIIIIWHLLKFLNSQMSCGR